MEQLFILLFTFLFPPVLGLVVLVLILATFGKSLGIRRRYVNWLLTVFEWGARQARADDVEEKRRRKFKLSDDEGDGSSADEQLEDGNTTADSSGSTDEGLVEHHGTAKRQDGQQTEEEGEEGSSMRRQKGSGRLGIIRREASFHIMEKLMSDAPLENSRIFTIADDSLDFIKAGMEAIIEDEVTSRFEAEHLASWNLLTRTSHPYRYVNWKLTVLWGIGFFFRYCVLFPLRMIIFNIGMVMLIVSTAIVGLFPESSVKRELNAKAMMMFSRIVSRSISAIVTFHDRENMARTGGICVANHTSPIDCIILDTDNAYALIGQAHGGALGVMQRALSRASAHIWFERSEAKDRAVVAKRLRDHVNHPHKLPILIFPEGTCINNTSVMMFKKGSFEVGTKIYPIAMKYDSRFGDPFWNSSEQSWMQYMVNMMTSWAIICDVWYLPPMERLPGEESITFASRVKRAIAQRGGLIDLEWDGQLKRNRAPPKLLQERQALYWARLNRSSSITGPAVPKTVGGKLISESEIANDPLMEDEEEIDSNDGDGLDSGVASEVAAEERPCVNEVKS